jgi:hypothetical protein
MLGIAHCPDNRLTDGSEVVKPYTLAEGFYSPQKHFLVLASESTPGPVKENAMTSSGIELSIFRLVA